MYSGIDIGGTTIRLASTKSLDSLRLENKISFPNSHNFEKDFKKIVRLIKSIAKTTEGIGIGIPGDLDKERSTVFCTNNLKEWEGKPILKKFEEEFHCSVVIDNDAVVAALGESHYGRYQKDFAYITWGTGIGGALVKKDSDHYNVTQLTWANYLASWEKACGGRRIRERFGNPPDKLEEQEWEIVMNDFLKELVKFARKLRPRSIVFGGGISLRQKARLMNLASKLKTQNFLGNKPIIKITQLGGETGLYGAFVLLRIYLSQIR